MRICEQKMIRTVEQDMFYLRSLQSMNISRVENEKGQCAYILFRYVCLLCELKVFSFQAAIEM